MEVIQKATGTSASGPSSSCCWLAGIFGLPWFINEPPPSVLHLPLCCVCVQGCVQASSFIRTALWPALLLPGLILTNHIHNSTVYTSGHVPRCWGVRDLNVWLPKVHVSAHDTIWCQDQQICHSGWGRHCLPVAHGGTNRYC